MYTDGLYHDSRHIMAPLHQKKGNKLLGLLLESIIYYYVLQMVKT